MMRFVVLALVVLAVWLLLLVLYRWARRAAVDWTGIAFMVGFVTLAFYLHHATGIGF